MIGDLVKLVAYSKAPRTTFMLRHPVSAVQLRKMRWDLRHAPAPRLTAIGAFAVALPIGYLAGRMTRGERVAEPQLSIQESVSKPETTPARTRAARAGAASRSRSDGAARKSAARSRTRTRTTETAGAV